MLRGSQVCGAAGGGRILMLCSYKRVYLCITIHISVSSYMISILYLEYARFCFNMIFIMFVLMIFIEFLRAVYDPAF